MKVKIEIEEGDTKWRAEALRDYIALMFEANDIIINHWFDSVGFHTARVIDPTWWE